jgi:glucose/arabinose dehydrogenase
MMNRYCEADGRGLSRRAMVGAAAGAVTACGLPSLPVAPASAAVLATPDPIPARIERSGLRLSLQDFATPPATSAARPRALLSQLYHAGDGSGRLFAADSRGKLWAIDAAGKVSLFLDVLALRSATLCFGTNYKYMGLRSFAFHPDFARPGRPGYRRFYTLTTETPGSAAPGVRVLGNPTLPLAFHDVLAEWQVDGGTPQRVNTGSRREVLRIRQAAAGHNAEQLLFNPSLTPGTAGYGQLFVSTGDGKKSTTRTDPLDQAQDSSSPCGKILCIDPLARAGRGYTVPASNPFVGRAGSLPEIWALGLRYPQFMSFDRGGSRRLYVSNIGQAQIEALCLGVSGANYGWPLREGTFVTERTNENVLYELPADDARVGFTYPVAQYDHDEGQSLCAGFVYRGTAIPNLIGHYLYGDMVNGRLFHVPVMSLVAGKQATVREITLLQGGRTVTLRGLLGNPGRVELWLGQDQAGEMYLTTKQDGIVRKLAAA